MKSTHSDRLERWLGSETVERISQQVKGFYYPIPLHGVAGNVFVMPDGDFAGDIAVGQFLNKHDAAALTLQKIKKRLDAKHRQSLAAKTMLDMIALNDANLMSIGAFASIDAVVAAATGGKGQALNFAKTGVASNAIGNSNDLWTRAGMPSAGAAGSAAPAGVAPTSATTGALKFQNLGAANSGHYLNWSLGASVINNSLMLYDRLFAVVKTMNSTAGESVTGTPSRYQNTTAGAVDYIGGNFMFPTNPTTVLAATAHNWTVVYTDDTNTASNTAPTATGVSACVVSGIDLAAGQNSWFIPLAAGDCGVRNITSMTCSAAVATGTIDFVIAHPIAINACPIANIACVDDGLYTALNLTPILDSACLSFLEMPKPATTATTFGGIVRTVSE